MCDNIKPAGIDDLMNQFVPLRKHRHMSGAQKSAILFLCLGEERGGAIMQQLDVDEIRQITTAISVSYTHVTLQTILLV